MAIYHCSIKIISRGKGKSAVAAAAYRAGEKIISEYDGRVNDYTRKSGVVHTEILLPENAPPEFADRAILWNAIERIEKAKNSQLAREIEVALPRELTIEQNLNLVREYVKTNFVDVRMCADFAIHDKNDGNPHAHILLTMRPFNEDKSWGAKQRKEYIFDDYGEKIYDKKKRQYKCNSVPSTDWNDQSKAEEWRSAWADSVNSELAKLNISERIDHRSYARQGVEQIPTIHLGTVAHQLEQRGIRTERGDRNREISISNRRLRQLKRNIVRIQKWLNKERKIDKSPTLADAISEILNRDGGRIYNLKSAAKMLKFLTENDIAYLSDLDDKFKDMVKQQTVIQQAFKPIERRLNTLDEHLKQSENYFANKKYFDELAVLKPRKQKKYVEEHRAELTVFRSANSYLKAVLNGRPTIPVQSWREEFEKLTTEKSVLNAEYLQAKSDVENVAKIQKSVSEILSSRVLQPLKSVEKSSPKPVEKSSPKLAEKPYEQMTMRERLALAKQQADERNSARGQNRNRQSGKSRVGRDWSR